MVLLMSLRVPSLLFLSCISVALPEISNLINTTTTKYGPQITYAQQTTDKHTTIGVQYELKIESSETNQLERLYFKIDNSIIRIEFIDSLILFVTSFRLPDIIPDIKIRWEKNNKCLASKIITMKDTTNNLTYVCDYVRSEHERFHQCTPTNGLDWKMEFTTDTYVTEVTVEAQTNSNKSITLPLENITNYAYNINRYFVYFFSKYQTINSIKTNKSGLCNIMFTNLSNDRKFGCTDMRKGSVGYYCTLAKRLKYELKIESPEMYQMATIDFEILHSGWGYAIPFKGSSTIFKKIVDLPENLGNIHIKWDENEKKLPSKIITMKDLKSNGMYMCDCVKGGSHLYHNCTSTTELNWKMVFEATALPSNTSFTIRQRDSTTSYKLNLYAYSTVKYFAYFKYISERTQDIIIGFTKEIPESSNINLYNFQNGTSLVPTMEYNCNPILNTNQYFISCKWTKRTEATTDTLFITLIVCGIGIGVILVMLLVVCLIRHHRQKRFEVRKHQVQEAQREMRQYRAGRANKPSQISRQSTESEEHIYAEL